MGRVRALMNLIERYIFRRAFSLTMTTLCITTAIVLITQVLLRVNILTESGESLGTFMMLALLLVPSMALIVMPFALLIGGSQVLNTMNADSELAVIEAAGGSNWLMAKPILIIAVGLTIVSLGLSLFVEPWCNRSLRDITNAASADLVHFAVQSGAFKKLQDNLYIQIGEELPGGDFGGIFIIDNRQPPKNIIYYAKRGSIQSFNDDDFLVMTDGEIQQKNTETGAISVVRFQSYALDFSNFGAASKGHSFHFPKEQSTAYLFHPDPNDIVYKTRPGLLRAELHRRFSDWLYPLAFGIITIYFAGGARSNREERLWSMAFAGLIALGFRAAGFVAVNNAGRTVEYAFVPYLVVLTPVVIFTVLIFLGKTTRGSQKWTDKLWDIFSRMQSRLSSLRPAADGSGRSGSGGVR
ncbi:MAG: LptF/LptG family permease [Rhizobiaceae bacterium]